VYNPMLLSSPDWHFCQAGTILSVFISATKSGHGKNLVDEIVVFLVS
jgi:hypothetical protein